MSLLGSYVKQPAEVESYTISYEEDLDDSDVVETSVVSITPVTDPPLEADSLGVDDPRVRVLISGGVNGTTYKVTLTTTTSSGRVLQDEFKLRVKDY